MYKKSMTMFIAMMFFLSWGVFSDAAEKKAAFPNKPIRFIVRYAPGTGDDIHARQISPYVGKHLGERVIIENRPGADGRIGMNEAWKAAPDGYTIVNAGVSTILNEKLFKVDFITKKFTHLFAWSQDNICLVVHAEGSKNINDFIDEARSRSMSGGHSGIGSISQVAGLALADAAALKPINWVPFRGGGETMTTLAGKHIDFGITTTSSAQALVDAGKLRVLLVFANEKDAMFPQASLPKDIGLKISALPIVRGVLAPPGLKPEVADKLRKAFANAIKEPDFLDWAKRARVTISPMNHEQFLKYDIGVEEEVMKYVSMMQTKQ